MDDLRYGDAFEHFVISQFIYLSEYCRSDFKFSYLRTKDDAEIDLIVERPGKSKLLIEIKSTNKVSSSDFQVLRKFKPDISNCEAFVISRDPNPQEIEGILAISWTEIGLRFYGISGKIS